MPTLPISRIRNVQQQSGYQKARTKNQRRLTWPGSAIRCPAADICTCRSVQSPVFRRVTKCIGLHNQCIFHSTTVYNCTPTIPNIIHYTNKHTFLWLILSIHNSTRLRTEVPTLPMSGMSHGKAVSQSANQKSKTIDLAGLGNCNLPDLPARGPIIYGNLFV